ncbi:hypothetical protein BKA64DRAFT_706121 [Cadophora sp. MPI-SDFR-AT-0126]|nr:hypothetical protein BKA64DRAFT_706121 [Leotiomycetes sp. MPI-SDFR-AT-0126]
MPLLSPHAVAIIIQALDDLKRQFPEPSHEIAPSAPPSPVIKPRSRSTTTAHVTDNEASSNPVHAIIINDKLMSGEDYDDDPSPPYIIDPEAGRDRRGIGNMERSFIEGMVPKNAEEIAYDAAMGEIEAAKNGISSLEDRLRALIPTLPQEVEQSGHDPASFSKFDSAEDFPAKLLVELSEVREEHHTTKHLSWTRVETREALVSVNKSTIYPILKSRVLNVIIGSQSSSSISQFTPHQLKLDSIHLKSEPNGSLTDSTPLSQENLQDLSPSHSVKPHTHIKINDSNFSAAMAFLTPRVLVVKLHIAPNDAFANVVEAVDKPHSRVPDCST